MSRPHRQQERTVSFSLAAQWGELLEEPEEEEEGMTGGYHERELQFSWGSEDLLSPIHTN